MVSTWGKLVPLSVCSGPGLLVAYRLHLHNSFCPLLQFPRVYPGWLVSWLVGWLVGRMTYWLVGWLVDWLVDRLVG